MLQQTEYPRKKTILVFWFTISGSLFFSFIWSSESLTTKLTTFIMMKGHSDQEEKYTDLGSTGGEILTATLCQVLVLPNQLQDHLE